MKLEFEDDPRPLFAALESVGVKIQDERGEWLRRWPVLARLEIGLGAAFVAMLPFWTLIPSVQVAAGVMLVGVVSLAVVHWMAR